MARADNDLLKMALAGYEAHKARIDAAIKDIQAQLEHRGSPKAATDGAAPAKRVMSVAARRRIAAAQRKRWAATRKAAVKRTNSMAKAVTEKAAAAAS